MRVVDWERVPRAVVHDSRSERPRIIRPVSLLVPHLASRAKSGPGRSRRIFAVSGVERHIQVAESRPRSLRVDVPKPNQDRPELRRVGVIAAAGFAIGIVWPWIAGV